jgi:tRNA threonylcarbamoyl adenosine modification protein YeaZ
VLVLALDTSSAATSAAVVELSATGAAIRAARSHLDARAHGEQLAPAIAACLAEAGATPGDLAAVVAGTGPGPFTGLRVGLVTAAVLVEALQLPGYGVCSLDAIAAAAGVDGQLLVLGDARRKQVYWAHYRCGDGAAGTRIAGPDVAKPDDLDLAGVTAVAGAGARLYADRFTGLTLLDADYPDPALLAGLARERVLSGAPGESLTPLYLRRPDAVVPVAAKPVTP